MTKTKIKSFKLPNAPKNPLIYLLVLLTTLIIGFFSGSFYSDQKQSQLLTSGTVTRIIDADNIELNNQTSVRLYAVSCPEKNEKDSDEVIDYLTNTVLNQKVTLEYQSNYETDKWGRTNAYVFIDGQHLNEQLIRQGFCTVTIYSKRAKLKYQDELIQAQEQAKQEKLGRWK